MKIALVYNKESEGTVGAYIEKVIRNAKLDYRHFWTRDSATIPKKFDLYFRIDHGDYKYDLSDDLHPAIFYAVDTHLKKPYKKMREQIRHYDIVFCAQKQGVWKVSRDTKVDVNWIPLGCDPQIHKKLNINKKYDVGFVGSQARKFLRGELIDLISERYSNSYLGGADFSQMSDIYSSSKIGFNYSIINDINMRIFEILSCGSFLLTNRIKDNGFSDLFENRKHLVVYRNKKDLLELIEYYLQNEQEREIIAKAGSELAINQYTYYHRVQTMFNYIAFKFGGEYNRLRI